MSRAYNRGNSNHLGFSNLSIKEEEVKKWCRNCHPMKPQATPGMLVISLVLRRSFQLKNSRKIHVDKEVLCHLLVEIVICSTPKNEKLLPNKVLEVGEHLDSLNLFLRPKINNLNTKIHTHRAFQERKSPRWKAKTNFQKRFMDFHPQDKVKTNRLL
jgi:hypothetical protein